MSRPLVYRHALRSGLRGWEGSYGKAWLSDAERADSAGLHDSRRREAWLFGRLLSKQVIVSRMAALPGAREAVRPEHLQISSRDGLGRATRPRILLHGRLRDWSLSLAHSDQSVLVAFSEDPGVAVGVDVAPIQSPKAGFVDLWFTPWERAWAGEREDQAPRRLASLWAVKEAFYKAVNIGERFAPSRIEVRVDLLGGYVVRCDGSWPGGICRVRVAATDGEVAAVVAVISSQPEMTP